MFAPIAAVLLILAADVSSADEVKPLPPHHFGEGGQLVTTGGLGISGSLSMVPGTGQSYWSLSLQPGIDWFVVARLSLGGALILSGNGSHVGDTTSSELRLGLAPRIGYLVPIADRFSWWPRLAIVGEWRFSSTSIAGAKSISSVPTVSLGLSLPFEYELAPHVVVGLGPSISGAWLIGLSSSVTGYF